MTVKIEESWRNILQEEFDKEYFAKLVHFVKQEYANYRIFPPGKLIFNAFDLCPFNKLRVVILGQDPYHEFGQAHGLAFSVMDGVQLPPSLINIYKEIKDDLGVNTPTSGNLSRWARQGVLLLNATLTVREHSAGSHQNMGWEEFTDAVISLISKNKDNIVFMLWGSYAQSKARLIDSSKHLVLKSPHPSPLSAYRGFFGNHHFSSANNYLLQHNLQKIDW